MSGRYASNLLLICGESGQILIFKWISNGRKPSPVHRMARGDEKMNPLERPEAVACLRGAGIRGTVKLIPQGCGTLVVAEVSGLPETETNFFAFHIHENGDCSGEGFPNTGAHFNPGGMEHPRHAGDLPPLLACGGKAYLAVWTGRFRVRDVIGRSAIIHSHPDDFKTQPSGGAREKIACGVIRRVVG